MTIAVVLPLEAIAVGIGLGDGHAVAVALDDVAGGGLALSEALPSTGGELSTQERAWADGVLDHGQEARTA